MHFGGDPDNISKRNRRYWGIRKALAAVCLPISFKNFIQFLLLQLYLVKVLVDHRYRCICYRINRKIYSIRRLYRQVLLLRHGHCHRIVVIGHNVLPKNSVGMVRVVSGLASSVFKKPNRRQSFKHKINSWQLKIANKLLSFHFHRYWSLMIRHNVFSINCHRKSPIQLGVNIYRLSLVSVQMKASYFSKVNLPW